MRIERMPAVNSPSPMEVLESPNPFGEKIKTYEVVGYRGKEPTNHISDRPTGTCILLGQGFVFLSSGQSHNRSSWGNRLNDFVFDGVGGQVSSMVSSAIPFAGILTGLGFSGVRAVLGAVSNRKSKIGKLLEHPDTFIVPYMNVVKCDYAQVDSSFFAKHFLVIDMETEHQDLRNYLLCMTGISSSTAKSLRAEIWKWRAYSDIESATALTREELGITQRQIEAVTLYFEQCKESGKAPTKEELEKELARITEETLRSHGLSDKEFLSLVWKRLDHLRPLAYAQPEIKELEFLRQLFAEYGG